MWKAAIFSALQVGGAAVVLRQWITPTGMLIEETSQRQWIADGTLICERP